MAQLVKALVTNPAGLSSVRGTNFVDSERLSPVSCLLTPTCISIHTHKQIKYNYIRNIHFNYKVS